MRSLAFAVMLLGVTIAGNASAADCSGLAALRIDDVNLLSATEVPAAGDLPAHCRVLGYVRPAINFEIRLPLNSWNGKFYMAGCGGFCGRLLSDAPGFTNAMNYGLRRNYAVATMDSGHWASSVVDGRWALHNPIAEMDWGQRSVTETARTSKAVIKAYYGNEQRHSYFAGCSTGGRMAAMQAARSPNAFDGVISGAPALDYTGLVATFFAWVTQSNTGPDGSPILTPARLPLIRDAVLKSCDSADGLDDGMIDDPRRCKFDLAALQCRKQDNAGAATCLTEAEVGALQKWYQGPKDAKGRQLYPGGIPLGSEVHWPRWLTGTEKAPPVLPAFAENFLRYMAFEPDPAPGYRTAEFDFDRDPPRLASMARVYNVTTFDPERPQALPGADLSGFREQGGKLLFYHGWADSLVTPWLTTAYYDQIAKQAGGMDTTRSFSRLFMVPGMDHCGVQTGGPGISDTGIDPLTALERWVEEGVAPDTLIASKTDAAGAVQWRRPVCAWPQTTRYTGNDPKDPASYTCAEP